MIAQSKTRERGSERMDWEKRGNGEAGKGIGDRGAESNDRGKR